MSGYPKIEKSATEAGGEVPDYDGEPGPVENRRCRDKLFLVLFAVFWAGMFAITGVAVRQGNLARLRYGNDSANDLCGVLNENGNDYRTMPKSYLFNPTNLTSYRRCIPTCPTESFKLLCSYNNQYTESNPPPNYSGTPLQKMAAANLVGCTVTIKSKSIMNRCVPNDVDAVTQLLPNNPLADVLSDNVDVATQVFGDIANSWSIILGCSAIGVVLSFVWLFSVQFFARPLVWLTVIVCNVASIAMTGSLWYYWNKVRTGAAQATEVSGLGVSVTGNATTLLVLGALSSVVTVVLVLLSLGLRRRIGLAIAVIKETSKSMRAMPFIAFFPVFKYLLLVGLTAYVVFVGAMLMTARDQVASTVNNQTTTTYPANRIMQGLAIYVGFGYLWTFNLILAISQTTIAGSVASWYWTRDKKTLSWFPVAKSLGRALRYHLGSLAIGAMIIAIVQGIRAALMYAQHQLKRTENKVAQYITTCLSCCFWCLEKVLKFLNKNAYIEIAIYGYDFCGAAKTAFNLIVRNAVRILVVDRVSDFLFLLGKLMVVFLTCLVGGAILQDPTLIGQEDDIGNYWGVSLALIAVTTYMVASMFMAVFDMAINTMFLCFCEDCERNDGSTKPYYMEDSLKDFIDNAGKAEKE